jgi:hypothetical protein
MSVLNYSFLFMLFSFVGGGGSVCPGAGLGYVPGRWVGESLVVCDAHLFILQVHARSFETGWWGEMVQLRGAFHQLGVQDVAEIDSD